MRKLVPPDEGAWALPPKWQEIMPRRGGFVVPPPETPEDPATWPACARSPGPR